MPSGRALGGRAINAAKCRRIRREALQSRLKESSCAAIGATLHVMVCSSNLNETLKKLLDVRFRDEPDRFPRLVRFPEFAPVEVIDSRARVGDEIGLQSPARIPFLN